MDFSLSRKLRKAAQNLPNLLQGFNIYVNREKLRLIDRTFSSYFPGARSFADLGGIWKVNAAYSRYSLKKFPVDRGILVDTDIPSELNKRLRRYRKLEVVQGDFGDQAIVDRIGHVDVIYFFDVLLHQANPDWDRIISRYAKNCPCFVIYNQQLIRGDETIRLTDLPFEEYVELTSRFREEFCRYVYEHRNEIHPKFHKPWKDIHTIAQWGITDSRLRGLMQELGYREVYFENHGMFVDLPAFENHAFVFKRNSLS